MPVSHFKLGILNIRLEAFEEQVFQEATAVFHANRSQATAVSNITITLQNQTKIPSLNRVDFVDEAIGFALQKEPAFFRFHFFIRAIFEVDLEVGMINGRIHPNATPYLEDMLYICLSPLLRQKEHYLLHGFAVQKEGQTILLIGESGSGKTTAGLSLLRHGWRFLANDVIILSDNPINIYPTFDRIRYRNSTSHLLCEGAETLKGSEFCLGHEGYVTAVYFIHLKPNAPTQVQRMPKATALAKLCESSLDRWDDERLPTHLSFLKRLCEETAVYQLTSGQGIQNLHKTIIQKTGHQ